MKDKKVLNTIKELVDGKEIKKEKGFFKDMKNYNNQTHKHVTKDTTFDDIYKEKK